MSEWTKNSKVRDGILKNIDSNRDIVVKLCKLNEVKDKKEENKILNELLVNTMGFGLFVGTSIENSAKKVYDIIADSSKTHDFSRAISAYYGIMEYHDFRNSLESKKCSFSTKLIKAILKWNKLPVKPECRNFPGYAQLVKTFSDNLEKCGITTEEQVKEILPGMLYFIEKEKSNEEFFKAEMSVHCSVAFEFGQVCKSIRNNNKVLDDEVDKVFN